MTSERDYWTIGTRDFRNLLDVELASPEAASRYRDEARLESWVVVGVSETANGRAYMSPEMPGGPVALPAAGTF